MNTSLIGRALAAMAALFFALAPASAQDPGDLWQTTSQMVMEGLPFSPPPTTLKICTAREWTQPPPGGDASCVTSNFTRVSPNKVTWTTQCSGEMPMTGTGEITFAADGSYTGAINATAEGMTMKIVLSGKKIGTCPNPIG